MCVMQSSILIEERGIIKAGLILLCQNHSTHRSCRLGGEWFSFLSAGKVFFISCPSFSSSASSTHLFGNHHPSTFLSFTFLHCMLHLPSVSSDISRSPSPACPWGQIGAVVKNQLNLTVWHYTVNLWVDRRCTAVRSVTAQEADSCLGHKPSDTIAFAAPQSGF